MLIKPEKTKNKNSCALFLRHLLIHINGAWSSPHTIIWQVNRTLLYYWPCSIIDCNGAWFEECICCKLSSSTWCLWPTAQQHLEDFEVWLHFFQFEASSMCGDYFFFALMMYDFWIGSEPWAVVTLLVLLTSKVATVCILHFCKSGVVILKNLLR